MRAHFLSLVLTLALAAAETTAFGQTTQPTAVPPGTVVTPAGPKAQIVFKETSHDFGDIKQGDKVQYTFEFNNAGQAPLVISNVQTTCGCTASEWSKEPILPGKTGQIKATFNSAGKIGRQNKVITVFSNALNPEERVSIVSNVLPADANIPGQKTENLQPK
jgi:hypothetical protein